MECRRSGLSDYQWCEQHDIHPGTFYNWVSKLLMDKLRYAGHEIVDCTVDTAASQNAYLQEAVSLANAQELDLFISLHFNTSAAHTGQGCEVYTYAGKQHQEAVDICANLAALGFKNRGVKDGSGLYVIKNTKAKAILVEICFCDNTDDVALYKSCGLDRIAQAIFDGICKKSNAPVKENHNMSREEFIEFVGEIAKQDWIERRLCLPSVVVAQAMKESGCGTSELAKNANALFGIKKNGWPGKTYIKAATEQRPDGSYYQVDDTEWRAYDSWEQSIIDHNDYIATRRIGNQTELEECNRM